MAREHEESGSGKWVAAVGGAATGAGVAFSAGTALKMKHGFRDAIAGAAHAVAGYGKGSIEFAEKFFAGLASPEAFQKFAMDNRALAEKTITRFEKIVDSKKFKENIAKALKDERVAASLKDIHGADATPEAIIGEIRASLAKIKTGFADLGKTTAEGWAGMHATATRAVSGLLGKAGVSVDLSAGISEEAQTFIKRVKESLPTTQQIDNAGFRKSLISRIPGGVHSITAAGGMVGAAMAYMAVASIEKSLRSSRGEALAVDMANKKWSEKATANTQDAALRAV